MIGTVSVSYLLHPLHVRDRLPSGASRQIAKDERIVGRGRLLRELSEQNAFQAAHPRLIDSTGVVSNQARKSIICAQLAKEPATIDGMEARIVQIRCIANVMQP